MKVRKILYADKGKVLTNGETYGTTVYLAEGDDGAAFYEITEKAYKKILEEQESAHESEV